MPKELSPSLSAQLALRVYSVNGGDPLALKEFLTNKVFAQGKSGQVSLKAEVGGRIVRAAKDSFGLCALGAGDYSGDAFLIFRGTTEANNKADWLTDARIGICTSETGLPVHIGFNHAFNSMLPEIRKFITEANPTGYIHCIGQFGWGRRAPGSGLGVETQAKYSKTVHFRLPRVGPTSRQRSGLYRRQQIQRNETALYKRNPYALRALARRTKVLYDAQRFRSIAIFKEVANGYGF